MGADSVEHTGALEVCAGLYAVALSVAVVQTAYRQWLDAERSAALKASRAARRQEREQIRRGPLADSSESEGGLGVQSLLEDAGNSPRVDNNLSGSSSEDDETADFIVNKLDRSRLYYVGQNLVLAYILRLTWIFLNLYNVAPVPAGLEESCKDMHTLVSATNRLAQLLCFTAYTSVAGFWANILRQHTKARRLRVGLSSEREVASALAQSTTRRRPGQIMVAVPDLFASERAQAEAEAGGAMGDKQGFNAIFSLCCMLLTPDIVQLLLNFWVYVIIIILLCVQWFECDKSVYDNIDRIETVTIASFFLVLGTMFLWYGLRLALLLKNLPYQASARLMRNTIIIACVASLFFVLRGILFLLEPLFAVRLNGTAAQIMYPWFFYPVPEIIPALLLLHLMSPRPQSFRSNNNRNVSSRTPLLEPPPHGQSGAPGNSTDNQQSENGRRGATARQTSSVDFGSFPKRAQDGTAGNLVWV